MNTKEFLTNRISELSKELDGLKRALSAYENSSISNIENINTEKSEEKSNKTIYNGTWIENILTVIKNKNRFLHNSEIAEELYSTYSDKNELAVRRRISAVLSTANSKGDIESLTNFRFSKSIKDTVWGKKEWLNEEGNIRKEYMYTINESQKQTSAFDF